MNGQRIVNVQHRPPANELPAVLDSGVVWRGDGIVVAIPSLLVYTTGAELLILCRTRHAQAKDVGHARATADALRHLTANGRAVELLGGEHQEHGFSYRAWVRFASDTSEVPGGDITFELAWPEVGYAEHRVPGVRAAAGRAVVLWPAPPAAGR